MYTFRHIALEEFHEYLTNAAAQNSGTPLEVLCRICDEEIICCSDAECAEYLGRLWALFGAPDNAFGDDDFYSYPVIAEKEEDLYYLLVSQYSSVPTIYGPQEALAAAQALAEQIRQTPPADYEWRGAYADYDMEVIYSVRDGKAFAEDQSLGIWDEQTAILNHIIDRVFDVMSAEDANAWVNRYTTPEEMLDYWNDHPELH